MRRAAVVWRGGCGVARGGAVGAHELQGRRFAARFAARGGQEVRVPARVRTSRLLKPSRRVRSVNVEIDHHGTDAPPRVAALPGGSVEVRVRALSAAARRLTPDPEVDASPVSGTGRLLATILGGNAHRPPLGCEPGRPGRGAKRAHNTPNGLGAL